tara:strand:- start:328 stop:666 length:339 start_codon:yes stop_codon:yes gene_type:complete
MIIILPNKDFNFDHLRPYTTFQQLIQDYNQNIGEDDLTHLDEILELRDIDIDKPAGSFEEFKTRSLNNELHRGLHHHVFNEKNISEMLDFNKFNIIENLTTKIDHIFVVSNN